MMVIIFIQDFRSRSIHVFTLIFLLLLLIPYYTWVREFQWLDAFLNELFLSFLLGCSVLVLRKIKSKPDRAPIGKGDIYFLFLSALFFGFPAFIAWINFALIISLLLHFLMIRISTAYRQRNLVPLAGLLSLVLGTGLVWETYGVSITELLHSGLIWDLTK